MTDLLDSGLPGVTLQPGDHVCAFYFGADEGHELLAPYARAALRAGDTCVCVLPPAAATKVLAAVGDGREPSADRLVLAHPPGPDQLAFPAIAGPLIAVGARTDGGAAADAAQPRPTRIAADVAWVGDRLLSPSQLLTYESELDRLLEGSNQVAMCFCDLERVDVATVAELLACHGQVLFGSRLFADPYYLPRTARERSDAFSRFDGLLALSMLMTGTDDPRRIATLAETVVSSLGRTHLDGLFLSGKGWQSAAGPCAEPTVAGVVEARLAALGPAGGPIPVPNRAWSWAFPLRGLNGCFGYLLVGGDAEPPGDEQFLLRVLAQQTSTALASVRLHQRQRVLASDLTRANAELADTNALLEWSTVVRERLSHVASAGEGLAGIADALHDMTGYAVAVEDRDGNLLAWTGPDQARHHPSDSPARRQGILARLLRAHQPIWDDGRLLTTAERAGEVVGTVALIDPEGDAGEGEMMALEDAAALLSLELAHRRELAETEARLGRNLLEELLDGTEDQSALKRARALGYDLERPHRVVAVEPWPGRPPDRESFFHAVRRAARDTGVGTLLVAHGTTVIVLSDAEPSDGDPPWESFRTAMLSEPGGGPCRVGIGDVCEQPGDVPNSQRQAQLALRLQEAFGNADQVIAFDQLGIYRMLAEIAETTSVEQYVEDWLGPLEPLLEYDGANGSDLVTTLSHYLECGGRYDATAKALAVHRSTIKYRLQRIKDISGYDLTDPDALFNLQLATRAWRTLVALHD